MLRLPFPLFLSLFLITAYAASDVPSNSTGRQGWTAEPNCGRGTASIIWQCVTTLVLCTYIAMHLDIPPVPLSATAAMLRKLSWAALFLVAPELMALAGYKNFQNARLLIKRSTNAGHNISMSQAFCILSGGLAILNLHKLSIDGHYRELDIDSKDDVLWCLLTDMGRVYDSDSIVICAQHVPSTSLLQDTSKADILAKLFTSIQVIWTLVQVIARARQGLAISLLEYATIGYVIIAAISYGLWWKKPYGVSHHYIVEADRATQLGTLRANLMDWQVMSNDTYRGPLHKIQAGRSALWI